MKNGISVLSVVGARPQFIKASIVSKKLVNYGIKEILVNTGQHYDYNMSDIFIEELFSKIPDYNLGIGSASHGVQTGQMMIELEKVIKKVEPEIVLVYGDTNSTLAGALTASKLDIPVAHVEAGLRSYNKSMPEEINRLLTDHVSDILFAPTDIAVKNLKKEGIRKNVYKVGDVMYDLALLIGSEIEKYKENILNKYSLMEDNFVLVTIHRAENTDNRDNLAEIFKALKEIANRIKVFFPVHPRTRKALSVYGLLKNDLLGNLILAEPISYKEMLVVESAARVILTDSGGVQKEAYFFRKPAVIPRKETEWVELVESGWAELSGQNSDSIYKSVLKYIEIGINSKWEPFYGDGNSSDSIARLIYGYFR